MAATHKVDLQALGKLVRDKRTELKMSTAKLASVSGVSSTRINQIENMSPTEYTGKIRKPRADTVARLAKALRLSDTYLLQLAGYHVQDSAEGSAESERGALLLPVGLDIETLEPIVTLVHSMDEGTRGDWLAIGQVLHDRRSSRRDEQEVEEQQEPKTPTAPIGKSEPLQPQPGDDEGEEPQVNFISVTTMN